MTGGTIEYQGYMSQKKQEELLTGERSMTRSKLELQVELPGRPIYAAKTTVSVPMAKVPFMSGGSVVPLLVDPEKAGRVAIGWVGEFKQGTVAEMAAANPPIAAAMRCGRRHREGL